jgi:hypothetical protein
VSSSNVLNSDNSNTITSKVNKSPVRLKKNQFESLDQRNSTLNNAQVRKIIVQQMKMNNEANFSQERINEGVTPNKVGKFNKKDQKSKFIAPAARKVELQARAENNSPLRTAAIKNTKQPSRLEGTTAYRPTPNGLNRLNSNQDIS